MVTAEELAADALAVANRFVSEERDRLLERVEGHLDLLVDAARIIRGAAAQGTLEHSEEHLAFSLLTAAFDAGRKKF